MVVCRSWDGYNFMVINTESLLFVVYLLIEEQDMLTPVWIIPILAVILMIIRIRGFYQSKFQDYFILGRAVIDIYFAIVYFWIALDPQIISADKAEAVRLGVLILFALNVFYGLIDQYKRYLHKKLTKKLEKILLDEKINAATTRN